MVRVGAGLFGLGVLAVVAIVVPFFFGLDERPTWLNLSALLLPVGLGVALLGLLLGAREDVVHRP